MDWTELIKALVLFILGSASLTCFAIGIKVMKCPDHVYNKHRNRLRRQGYLSTSQWDKAIDDILG